MIKEHTKRDGVLMGDKDTKARGVCQESSFATHEENTEIGVAVREDVFSH
jgi:hypothetical protein